LLIDFVKILLHATNVRLHNHGPRYSFVGPWSHFPAQEEEDDDEEDDDDEEGGGGNEDEEEEDEEDEEEQEEEEQGGAGLSDYEHMRLANISRNNQYLARLGIGSS
jgi:hypothetical protein